MTTTPNTRPAGFTPDHRPELTFDGFGINGPDEYRTRICTFTKGEFPNHAGRYGPMFAAAPELLEALRNVSQDLADAGEIQPDTLAMIPAAIARATGGQP